QLREKRRDLPLAEGVVKRGINLLRGDAQTRRRDPVNDQQSRRAIQLLVRGQVAQDGNGAEFVHQFAGPEFQLQGIRIFQRVLVLRAADAVFHRQVLHRLHEKSNVVDL